MRVPESYKQVSVETALGQGAGVGGGGESGRAGAGF